MGPKEIAVEYRTASNKMKQVKILAELNQCSERRIAEILRDEGAELPHKWEIQLQKPARASRKFPEDKAETGEDPSTPADASAQDDRGGANQRSDEGIAPCAAGDGEKPKERPLVFEEIPVAPHAADEARRWVDGVGPVRGKLVPVVRTSVDVAELLRAACSLLQDALPLEPEKFRSYAAGVLDLARRVTEKEG